MRGDQLAVQPPLHGLTDEHALDHAGHRQTKNHAEPENEAVDGASVFLKGVADKDGQKIPFTIRSERSVDVVVDVSALDNGQPFEVKADTSFPPELLLSKTYDRFFDGVDFTDSSIDLEEQVWAVLEVETRVSLGTLPHM